MTDALAQNVEAKKMVGDLENKVTLNIRDFGLEEFLQYLFQKTAYSLTFSDIPSDKITALITNVPVSAVLESIALTHSLAYEIKDPEITFYRADVISEEHKHNKEQLNLAWEPLNTDLPGLSERITLEVTGMNIVDILKFLAHKSHLNMILNSEKVKGPASLVAQNITIKEALKELSSKYKLNFRSKGDLIVVDHD